MLPPEVSPFNGPCNRANRSSPPLVSALTSPVTSLAAMPPPEVLRWALNGAGTWMVYFASLRFLEPLNQLDFSLVFEWDRTVTVFPS
jgi:hypothetical protein